jgi:hypothetical protein
MRPGRDKPQMSVQKREVLMQKVSGQVGCLMWAWSTSNLSGASTPIAAFANERVSAV